MDEMDCSNNNNFNKNLKQTLIPTTINIKNAESPKELYYSSSFLSKLFFIWSYFIISSPISISNSINNYNIFQSKKTSPSFLSKFKLYPYVTVSPSQIFKAIVTNNKFLVIKVIALSCCQVIFQLLQFISLRYLMISFTNNLHFKYKCLYGLSFILSKFINSLSTNHLLFNQNLLSTSISNQLSSLLYHKVIRAYNISDKNLIGKIINYIQFDCENIAFIFNYGPLSLIVPFQIIVCIYLIYKFTEYNIGVIYIIIVLLSIGFFCGFIIQKMYYSTQTNYLYRKDKRIKITNDVLHSLQEIKINRYEEYFYSKILKKRTKELFYLKSVLDQGIVNNFVFFSLPLYISIGVFVYTIYFINPKFIYNTSDLLTIILILNSLSYPLYRFPVFITCIIEAKVSCERICPFLNDKSISTTNLPFEFSQVDNIYKHNNKICLLGDIASGKSTFIKHIALSEKNGCCYTSQEHFIMNDTLRNNILFGDEYDEIKFKNVLNLTELDKDIEGFDAKEMKVCGVNGNMLSGGQKARVDIARALYKKNKYNVFLFDDAFASLNDKVARNVFMKGIVSYLGQQENNDNNINKLICSFSNLSFVDKSVLEFFDKFVYLVNGKMVFEGDYASFIQSTYYNKVISNSIEIKQETKNKTDVINSNNKTELTKTLKTVNNNKNASSNLTSKPQEMNPFLLIWYIGIFSFISLFIYPITYELLELSRTVIISKPPSSLSDTQDIKLHILNYGYLTIFASLFLMLREYTLYSSTYKANITFHNAMLKRLIKAPINTFHNIISNSEKINHLNKDLEKLKYPMKFFTYSLKYAVSLIITAFICFYYSKLSLISLPFMAFISYNILNLYLNKSKILNRIERESKSPIVSECSEALTGSIYIKCYKKENYFIQHSFNSLNHVLKCNILKYGSFAWYNLTIDIAGMMYLILLVIYCIIFFNQNGENVGLLLNYSVNLISNILCLMENIVSYFNEKVPLDRCDEYTKLEQEEVIQFGIGNNQTCLNSDEMHISFKNFSIKYNKHLNPVLNNINIEIPPKSKIVIIGRTGSGKSSLMLSLLRIIQGNANYLNGQIYINNKSIRQMNLYELRSKISTVAQTPFVYDGTIQDNIDPKGVFKKNLHKQIEKFTFMEGIINKVGGLYKKIMKDVLSVGEKQLICLCRALLKNNKVLILDEASANIDLNTEKIIYDTINECCKEITVISIMHKKEYMNYFDTIIEMDNGRIVSISNNKNR